MFSLAVAAALTLAQATPPPAPPTIPPASLDDSLEIDGEGIDAKQLRTRLFVPVEVNGKGPFNFLVDSGADRSVVSTGLASRLGLPPGRRVRLRGMAGAADVDTVEVDTLKIGTSEIFGISAPALPANFIGAQGLIGIDALADQRMMLDFDKLKITVQDSRKPPPAVAGEIVVTARRRNGQLILTEVSTVGRRMYAVIDTGSEVTLGNLALQARLFKRLPPPHPITLISVTGQSIVANLATLPEMRIGSITLTGVQVAFVDAPPFALFGLGKEPAMLLGTDVLKAFRRVSLDFKARKVRFVLR